MKTALYDIHKQLGAKIVDFAGWQMPLHYSRGTLHEHNAVRSGVGIFDVSHMGRITVVGPAVELLCTNEVANKKAATATYTVLARDDGTSVDDTLVYKVDEETFFFVVNAANREKTLAHIHAHADKATVTDHYNGEGILAVQGPDALPLVASLFPQVATLAPFHFTTCSYKGSWCLISKTGYTGAGGVEIYCDSRVIVPLWQQLVDGGAEPIGLGARDTLRLEMGYALYGHELSDTIAPTESVSAWAVKFSKHQFIGKTALLKLEESGHKRKQYGIVIEGRGIAREGSTVSSGDIVTSGGYSPTLKKSIAIIMSKTSRIVGDTVTIDIRGTPTPARVVALPFIPTASCKEPTV